MAPWRRMTVARILSADLHLQCLVAVDGGPGISSCCWASCPQRRPDRHEELSCSTPSSVPSVWLVTHVTDGLRRGEGGDIQILSNYKMVDSVVSGSVSGCCLVMTIPGRGGLGGWWSGDGIQLAAVPGPPGSTTRTHSCGESGLNERAGLSGNDVADFLQGADDGTLPGPADEPAGGAHLGPHGAIGEP